MKCEQATKSEFDKKIDTFEHLFPTEHSCYKKERWAALCLKEIFMNEPKHSLERHHTTATHLNPFTATTSKT